jgi:hypothetical protein
MSEQEFLLHTTSVDVLERVANEGLTRMSYWAEPGRISDYYAETVSDEDKKPVALRLPLSVLERFQPEPDHPGLEEPLTYTLGMSEEEVWEQWEETDKSWQGCLELIGSIRIKDPIPAALLLEYNPDLHALVRPERPRSGPKM